MTSIASRSVRYRAGTSLASSVESNACPSSLANIAAGERMWLFAAAIRIASGIPSSRCRSSASGRASVGSTHSWAGCAGRALNRGQPPAPVRQSAGSRASQNWQDKSREGEPDLQTEIQTAGGSWPGAELPPTAPSRRRAAGNDPPRVGRSEGKRDPECAGIRVRRGGRKEQVITMTYFRVSDPNLGRTVQQLRYEAAD
jgi:hypothetical protein